MQTHYRMSNKRALAVACGWALALTQSLAQAVPQDSREARPRINLFPTSVVENLSETSRAARPAGIQPAAAERGIILGAPAQALPSPRNPHPLAPRRVAGRNASAELSRRRRTQPPSECISEVKASMHREIVAQHNGSGIAELLHFANQISGNASGEQKVIENEELGLRALGNVHELASRRVVAPHVALPLGGRELPIRLTRREG